jgi:HSP20 family protein
MTLMRWSPLLPSTSRELAGMQDEVNRLFDSMFSRTNARRDFESLYHPATDVQETPEDFVVRVDLPGVSQKDVKVSLMGDTLTIRGERKRDEAQKNGNAHRLERVYGTFERTFTFGTPVRGDGVKAQVRDGVLEVRVPKAEEARVREIDIQIAS